MSSAVRKSNQEATQRKKRKNRHKEKDFVDLDSSLCYAIHKPSVVLYTVVLGPLRYFR